MRRTRNPDDLAAYTADWIPGSRQARRAPRNDGAESSGRAKSESQLLPPERLLDGEEITPHEALLDRGAQEIGGVESRHGADFAPPGVKGVPAPARTFDAVLDAEQRLRR